MKERNNHPQRTDGKDLFSGIRKGGKALKRPGRNIARQALKNELQIIYQLRDYENCSEMDYVQERT